MKEIPAPLLEPLGDALTGLLRKHPGLSTDEADAFTLGFWAGAAAFAISLRDDAISADEVAERVTTALHGHR